MDNNQGLLIMIHQSEDKDMLKEKLLLMEIEKHKEILKMLYKDKCMLMHKPKDMDKCKAIQMQKVATNNKY